MIKHARSRANPGDPIKHATVATLGRVLDPLIELMLDSGMTVHHFNKLVRERAVHVAMKRLIKEGSKESKSRAAIMTGLSRSEVAKVLRSPVSSPKTKSDELPARRILAAWHDKLGFPSENGDLTVLPIFGRNASFEQLVNKHGGGIPVRALLDELTQMQAVERLPDQRVKLRQRLPIVAGLTLSSISAVAERSHDLLKTLAYNRRESAQQLFESTAVSDNVDREMISHLKREMSQHGTQFVEKIGKLLAQSEGEKNLTSHQASPRHRLGITVFLFHDVEDAAVEQKDKERSKRKNLRRRIRKDKMP